MYVCKKVENREYKVLKVQVAHSSTTTVSYFLQRKGIKINISLFLISVLLEIVFMLQPHIHGGKYMHKTFLKTKGTVMLLIYMIE